MWVPTMCQTVCQGLGVVQCIFWVPFIGGCEDETRAVSASMDTEQAAPLNQSTEYFACQAKSHALMSNDDS